METEQWLSDYFNWLHAQYKTVALKAGDEITTPFTNSIGDNIRIYAMIDTDNRLVMTDDGNTLNDLEMMGIDVSNPTRQSLIQDTLKQYAVALVDDGILQVTGSIQDSAVMKQSLLQAILRVGDLIQTRKGVVSNIFNQEVKQFFFDQDIGVLPQYSLTGGTGNTYTVDFAIPGSRHKPLRLIQAINRPTFERVAAESVTFDDIKQSATFGDTEIRYVIIFNDLENPMPEKASNLATRYGTELLPWSQKKQFQLN